MSENTKPLIEIKNLVKKFGSFTALNGVSLDEMVRGRKEKPVR